VPLAAISGKPAEVAAWTIPAFARILGKIPEMCKKIRHILNGFVLCC
jgi:hypothetical protein